MPIKNVDYYDYENSFWEWRITMAFDIRRTPGFDRSTSGVYEKLNMTEAGSVKQTQAAKKLEEGQIVEGTVCEQKGQKSIQIQGEELPVSSEVVKEYNVGESVYLKVDTKEQGMVSLKLLSKEEVEQIKAEQSKTESVQTGTRATSLRTGSGIEKGKQELQAFSKKIETATGEIAKLIKNSKVTVTVSKEVEKAVEKVVNELDVPHMELLEHHNVEVQNTDVRTLSNMISNIDKQVEKEANKEEIMKETVQKAKELSTFPDGKMYYMISNELELTVNNLYKAEYSYDKDYQCQPLTKEEWAQLKPKVEEYLKKEHISPNKENVDAAKWLMDHKLELSKANIADVKAMNTMAKDGVEENVLKENVKHYFELNVDPKEANVFYQNESKIAEKLMEKVTLLENKDMESAIQRLVEEEKPITLDNILKEVEKQEAQVSKDVVSKDVVSKDVVSKDAVSKDVVSKDVVSKDVVSKESNLEEGKSFFDQKSDVLSESSKKTDAQSKADVSIKEQDSKEANVQNMKDNKASKEESLRTEQLKTSESGKQEVLDTKESMQNTQDVINLEKVLDELDEKDINYRKLENQTKRTQGEKDKKEEKSSAKEEVSYGNLGKNQIKRQPKRFQMKDLAVTEESKEETSENVKQNPNVNQINTKENNQTLQADKSTQVKDETVSQEKVETDVHLQKEVTLKETDSAKPENAGTEFNKEEVSYENIGKNHIKRQPKRFQMKDLLESTEPKEETLKNENLANTKEMSQVTESDKNIQVKEEHKVPQGKTQTVERPEDVTLEINDKSEDTDSQTKEPSENVDSETKKNSQENAISVNSNSEADPKNKTTVLNEELEKELQKGNPIFNQIYEESGKNKGEKEVSKNETSKMKENSYISEIEGNKDLVTQGKAQAGPEEKSDDRRNDSQRDTQTDRTLVDKKEAKEQVEFSSKEDGKEDVRKLSENKESVSKTSVQNDNEVLKTSEKESVSKEERIEKENSDKEMPKAQNRKESPSMDKAELEAKVITAKRQLEEIRLKLTLSSAKVLAKNDIKIDTKELSEIVDQLKELEKEACKKQLIENRIEPTEENIEQFRITTKMAEELKEMPSYSIAKFVREPIPMTMEGLHEEGKKVRADFNAANERYETLMTKPRSDMGDSINKAFRNVDDILREMDMEVTEANQRAVRILGYNSMEITQENLEAVKAKDLSVNRLLTQLTPQNVMELIRKGENIIQTPIEELNLMMESMNNEVQEKDVARYSEFLYKLEKNHEITKEERTAFVGMYRLLDKVVKSKGRDIGALVKSGQEITLKNLLTAQRTIKASKIDANIDDNFGMVSEVIEKGIKITDQIEQGFAKASNSAVMGMNDSQGTLQMQQTQVAQGVQRTGNSSKESLAGIKAGTGSLSQQTREAFINGQSQEELINAQTQNVEQAQTTKQESLVQQQVSYQQDLAKEILEYINPDDLKSLSKVFGQNLENVSFEQIRDRLSKMNGRTFDGAVFADDVVMNEYQEEQMKEWKQLAQTEQRVIKALSDYDVSKTLSNAKAFETIFSKETPLFEQIKKEFEPKTKKEEKDKKLQKAISNLGAFFDGKEEAVRAYEDFSEELMDQSGREETLTTKDILARKNLMLAGNLMAKMARQESFVVPVQIQNKDATMEVTLKSEGANKGTIQAKVTAGNFGEITAELLVEENTVSVSSKADSKEGEAVLKKALGTFESALAAKKITLKQSAGSVNGSSEITTRQLYQVAKSFVEAFRA